jgi:hypothetical protein
MVSKSTQSISAATPIKRAAEWIEDMKRQFAETGTYRATDVFRLLGSPNTSAQVTPPEYLAHEAKSSTK